MPGGVQGYDRYAYVNNNPVRYTDPTGHRCNPEDACEGIENVHTYLRKPAYWKANIKRRFGITMSDDGGKEWDLSNLLLMSSSLQNIDNALNGKLKSLVEGATFRMREYELDPESCPRLNCTYDGVTSLTTVTFNTTGNDAIRQMNIYHEFGHLLDNSPGMVDRFSGALQQRDNSNFINGDGYLDQSALNSLNVDDPNHDTAEARQASNGGEAEQWADMFANYVAGNIDTSDRPGQLMNSVVQVYLLRYANILNP